MVNRIEQEDEMKKNLLLALVMLVLMAFALTGCSDNNGGDPSGDTDGDVTAEKNGYAFESNGVEILMFAQAEDVLSALGEENTYFEAESCAFQGMDKIYTYNGFEVRTNEIDQKDYITSVMLIDDTVATPEGVSLFMTKADMVAAYGEDFTEDMGLCTYVKGKSTLSFLIQDDEIVSIEYCGVADDK